MTEWEMNEVASLMEKRERFNTVKQNQALWQDTPERGISWEIGLVVSGINSRGHN